MTDVELIKSKIDIIDFISEYIQLKKTGRNFKALCPFHSEKTPSFIVSPERQSWYCFGACATGGDVISFLQKWENIEFLEALKILANKAGVTLSGYAPTDSLKQKEKLYEINHLAAEFYHFLLTSHKLGLLAKKYLEQRGIKKATIETFQLGYAPDSWRSLINYLQKKGYSRQDIFTAGLAVKSQDGSYYDRFRGRVIFTLKNHRGNTVGFSGRKLPRPQRKETTDKQEAKYINSPETPIYIKGQILYGLDKTKEAIKKAQEAVVVEGEFDFLAAYQTGVTNIVAIKGSALTEDQTILLKRFTENLVLALDSDFAGNEAARRGIEIADASGLTVRVVELPSGKDPAECIEKEAYLFKKAVKEAVPVYDFVINAAFKKYNKKDILGKRKIGNETVPFLAKITNPIIQSHYIKKVAAELEVSEESIQLAIQQFQKKQTVPKTTSDSKKVSSRSELLEEYLLSLILQSPTPSESFLEAIKIVSLDDFSLFPVRQIMEQLTNYFKKRKKLEIKKFSLALNPELLPTFDRALMLELEKILSQKSLFSRELIRTSKEIKKNSLRRRIEDISTKLKNADDNEEKSSALNIQLRELIGQLKELDK